MKLNLIVCFFACEMQAMRRSPHFYFSPINTSDETLETVPNIHSANLWDALQNEAPTITENIQLIFGPSNSSEALRETHKIVGKPSYSSELLAQQAERSVHKRSKRKSKKQKRKEKLETLYMSAEKIQNSK